MSEWQIVVNDGEETLDESDGLYDARTVDTFNPFGDYATAWFDDIEGELFEIFNRGTKVSFQYDDDTTNGFVQDFVGFVVNDFENEADGAEQLEVEAYTFDQFLRGDEISNSQEGKLISEALEDVITTDVPPVDWDASLVDVEDDIELTRSYQGENVEEFLLDLRQKSGGEFPSVTEDLRFEWKRPEIERTERDIDNTQWITHDISEQGGDTKNQITVVFDDGDRAVTVDESGDQLQTQENLGASGPAQQAADPLVIDDITTIDDAIDAGERFLQRRESTITGPVTTFGLNSAEPGNVIGVTIEPRGIDSDFRIAENRTRWRGEINELVVVQRKGADDDILLEQTDRVRRVEGRSRDLDVTPDRVTDTKPNALVDVTADANGVSHDVTRFVNDGKNRLRDGLINENPVASFEVAFSTTDDRPSRSDSDIADKVDTAIPNVTTEPQSVTYSADTSMDNIRTVGVFDADTNTLLAVARLESAVDAPSVDLTLSFGDDPETPKSVWTNTGLNLARDILSDNSPDWPDFYSYGSGESEPDVSDTSLDTEVINTDLDTVLLEIVDSTSDWESITDIGDETPATTANDALKTTQTLNYRDALDFDSSEGPAFDIVTDADYVDGEAPLLSVDGQVLSYDLTWYDHFVPQEEVGIAIRLELLADSTFDIRFNGDVIDSADTGGGLSVRWIDVEEGFFQDVAPGSNTSLEPGTTYPLEVETIDGGTQQEVVIDQIALFDRRYYPEVDNWSDEGWGDVDDNQQLAGPSLFPQGPLEFDAPTITTRRNITQFSVTSEWNATDNEQFIEARIGDEAFTRENNSDTISVTGDPDTSADFRFGLSHTTNDSSDTPTNGDAPQEIGLYSATGNPDAITNEGIGTANVRAIVEASEAVDDAFAEAGLKATSGDMLTRSLIPQFVKSDDQLVVSSERLRWEND